ncbi:SDR family NAD(P)-dependent oxidoreductase [Leifsonia sp. 21MFCrub1.1]|uniref:SDR family NAD(P)-dependent oxidoreductase n=1 Tax=Leifsonia sp. 21MFCrub1.1 TaxID=1798223 RepID=UPI0008928D3E|nr:SDR family oxidoreductase [Leifsonia sp. 21MFCrub1.1]SEB11511.1 3-oxoacyl-[acyl-carrier protein] reductase [Leifsonia sp. 21MFCrub1.1]
MTITTASTTASTTGTLAGKKALVTGGARGIGEGIARALAAHGAEVAVTYRASRERADALVADIEAAGGRAVAVRADASDADAARAGVRDAVAALGGLDILVNNAGGGWFEDFTETPDEHIEATIDLNIRGTVYATQAAIPLLPDGGRIITIGSVNAERIPFTGGAVYGLTKAAMVGFTKGLARDLAGRGITVNVIQPGPIDTEGNPADGEAGDYLAGFTAFGRFGHSSDVGELVSWIASDASGYMTGSAVTIDGGWTA